jgi:17beta-estradiol 17-dehydrogenase / very-long-chain 3-oxoacyl-CoA reductase
MVDPRNILDSVTPALLEQLDKVDLEGSETKVALAALAAVGAYQTSKWIFSAVQSGLQGLIGQPGNLH